MDRRLSLSIILFFIFLLLFITIVLISEYKNMDRLKVEYPNIPKESYDYRKSNLNIWAINLEIKFLFPLLLLITGISKRIGVFANGNGRNLFSTGFIYMVIFLAIELLVSLPTSFYSSFILKHRFGLSNQTIYRWIEIILKSFILNGLVLSLFVWFPYYLMYRSPNRWWFYLGLFAIPIIVFITFISPCI